MSELLETSFSGPNLPASVLLVMVCMYWLMVIIGGVGLDLFDFDLDVGGDADVDADLDAGAHSLFGMGMVGLRFLNLGRVPFMLWISLFAVSLWAIGVLWNPPAADWRTGGLLLLRNGALALAAAKLLSQPLRGRFDPVEPNRAKDLIGREVVITTSEVSQTQGRAHYATGAAPLLLNVRSVQGVLAKGERARIVEYDAQRRIFLVERASEKAKQEVEI